MNYGICIRGPKFVEQFCGVKEGGHQGTRMKPLQTNSLNYYNSMLEESMTPFSPFIASVCTYAQVVNKEDTNPFSLMVQGKLVVTKLCDGV